MGKFMRNIIKKKKQNGMKGYDMNSHRKAKD